MKGLCFHLRKNEGVALVTVILIVFVLSTLGLALAASTVSNVKSLSSSKKLEAVYYETDGAMARVEAIIERAAAYGRKNAMSAADSAYAQGLEDEEPLTAEELWQIYKNTFQHYLTNGPGFEYINTQLNNMETDERFLAEATVDWAGAAVNEDGLNITVTLKILESNQRMRAEFLLPYNYIPPEDITEVRSAKSIGYFNPLFRAAFTTSSKMQFNSSANLIFDARHSASGIALQWTDKATSVPLINPDAGLSLYGTTIPILEGGGSQMIGSGTIQDDRWKRMYVNDVQVSRSTPCELAEIVPIKSITDYYDPNLLGQIVTNKSDQNGSYFEAVDGDCVLRIYKGDHTVRDTDQPNKSGTLWKELSNKRGLVVIAGKLDISSGCPLENFRGAIVVLGNGEYKIESQLHIIHDEDAVWEAMQLYQETTDSDALLRMFNIDTLMENDIGPVKIEYNKIVDGVLFDSPLTVGNSEMGNNSLSVSGGYPYLSVDGKSVYLTDSGRGLQSAAAFVNLEMKNTSYFYHNDTLIWKGGSNPDKGDKPVANNVGEIYNLVNREIMKNWKKDSGYKVLAREEAVAGGKILQIHMSGVTIKNNGKIAEEVVTGRKGLIFVNGRLIIEGAFEFEGAVIATNGIEIKNGGDVRIKHNKEVAIAAANMSIFAANFFAPGSTTEVKQVSLYDNDSESGGGGSSSSGSRTRANSAGSLVSEGAVGIKIKNWNLVR